MGNIFSKTLLIVVIIASFAIYVTEYSNWSAGAGMIAGELLMIAVYEFFGPYLGSLLDDMDKDRESEWAYIK